MATRSPLLHAEALEHVGEALHLVEQVGVGDRAGVAGLALPVDTRPCRPGRPRRGGRGSCTTTLSLPPTNHLANGSSHSRIVCQSARPVEQLARPGWPRSPRRRPRPRRRRTCRRRARRFLNASERRERAVLARQRVDRLVRFLCHVRPPLSSVRDVPIHGGRPRPPAANAPPARLLRRRQVVEGQVEGDDVDGRLAEHPEGRGRRCGRRSSGGRCRRRGHAAAATRVAWMRALATEMCGSRPEPDAVTASTGTSASSARPFSSR